MYKLKTLSRVISAVGLVTLLAAFMTTPIRADDAAAPQLEPSPRPPWYATLTPEPEPTSTPAPPPPPTPTPAPTSTPEVSLLPLTGDSASRSGRLVGLGLGLLLTGLAFAVVGQCLDRQRESER